MGKLKRRVWMGKAKTKTGMGVEIDILDRVLLLLGTIKKTFQCQQPRIVEVGTIATAIVFASFRDLGERGDM